jgi:hypothetical protein
LIRNLFDKIHSRLLFMNRLLRFERGTRVPPLTTSSLPASELHSFYQ